jgi:hypothetical protein
MRILYIAGSDRSGSTLLARLLGTAPGFFAAGEVWHIFGRGFVNNELCGCGSPFRTCPFWGGVAEQIAQRIPGFVPEEMERTTRHLVRMRRLPALVLGHQSSGSRLEIDTYVEVLRNVYSVIAEVARCSVLIDSSKNAVYGHMLTRMATYDVHVVHLIRDSRGVAFSWARRKRRPEVTERVVYMDRHGPVRSAADWSISQLTAETLNGATAGCIRLRYEDWVRDPAFAVEAMREVMDLDGTQRLEAWSVPGAHLELEIQHTLSGNPTRFQRGATLLSADEEWESAMTPARRAVVTALTWPLLRRYGYYGRGTGRRP